MSVDIIRDGKSLLACEYILMAYARSTLHRVDDTLHPPQVTSLVGEAIATLAGLGVSAQVLGEFAMKYPAKVVAVLGVSTVEQGPSDLEKVVFEQVTRALRAEKGMRVTQPQHQGKRRINVLVKGKRTTLSISAHLVAETDRVTGSRGAGRKLIQELAEQAPLEIPRSTWTEQELHQRLLFLTSKTPSVAQH